MSTTVCKRSSLIAIVNRLYLNANSDLDESVLGPTDSKEEKKDEDAVTSPKPSVVSREASQSPKGDITAPKPASTPIIPLSSEVASSGLTAVGGCRQCSRTFPDRLSLIHHFVDHFPAIFYSFESSSTTLMPIMPTATGPNALGISNVSQILHTSSQNNGQYASGIQSMMFFPLVSLNNNNHQQQPTPPASQHARIKELSSSNGVETVPKRNKVLKDSKPKNSEKGTESKELNNRFTDFNKNGNDLPYDMCPHCCQTFADHGAYSEHLKGHDTPIISLDASLSCESPLKCEYCDLRFSNEYLLKEHKKIHSRICSVCSKILMTAFDLNLHMGVHSGFSYDCKDCGRCFPDRKALALHNKMHRSDLSTQDSDEEKATQKATTFSKENIKKLKTEKSATVDVPNIEDKPESFFKSNPYFENIFKQNTRKRRQRTHRSGASVGVGGALQEADTENPTKKKLRNACS